MTDSTPTALAGAGIVHRRPALVLLRVALAILGLAGLVGLYLEFYTTLGLVGFINYASYYTNLSNLGYAVVNLLLAFAPGRLLERRWFIALRGTIKMSMVMVGLGYAVMLSDTAGLFRNPWINYVLHAIMPLVALVDWLVWPPGRPRLRFSTEWLRWMVYPLVWSVLTLIRGLTTDWWTYPSIDPGLTSVPVIIVTSLVMYATMVGLITALVAYQAWRTDQLGRGAPGRA